MWSNVVNMQNCHSIYIRNVYIYALCLECALKIGQILTIKDVGNPADNFRNICFDKNIWILSNVFWISLYGSCRSDITGFDGKMLQQVPLAICPIFAFLLCLFLLFLSYELLVDSCEIFIDILQGLYSLRRQRLIGMWIPIINLRRSQVYNGNPHTKGCSYTRQMTSF